MNQYQYQNQNPYDPFKQPDEEMEDHERFHPSSMLMRDLESYARQEQKRKTFRFRMISLIVAAVILGPLSIGTRVVLNRRNYNYDNSEDYTYTEEYSDEYHVYDINYTGGEDEYYDGDGEIGEDMGEPELLLNGTYYRLPAPLHMFIEDGWNVVYNDYDGPPSSEIEADWPQYITLQKDNLTLGVKVGSPSGETIPIDNSYVLGFFIDRWNDISLELPGGIMPGDDIDDAIEQIKESGLEFELEEDDWGTEVTVRKRLNTYGDYKYYNVTLSSYSGDGTIDSIDIDTKQYRY